MSNIVRLGICVCLLFQSITGKSIDFNSGYQEIEDNTNILTSYAEENEQMREDRLSITELEDICKNLRSPVSTRETDSYVKCLQRFLDDTREIKLVKRNAENINETLEGSGDSDDQKEIPAEGEEPTEELLTTVTSPEESSIHKIIVAENSSQITSTQDTGSFTSTTSKTLIVTPSDQPLLIAGHEANNVFLKTQHFIKEEDNPAKILEDGDKETHEATPASTTSNDSETPVLFKNGFDEILKNVPGSLNNTSIKEGENPVGTQESGQKENVLLETSNIGTTNVVEGGEISKAGESQEESSASSPNSILLIVFVALGIVGTLAFAFNYIKKKREERELNEIIKPDEDGRELKEIKPLIKSTLSQNGAKSLEYIDADPQEEVEKETREEMNQNLDNVNESKAQI